MWCLHMVYLPMINKHLESWRASWIHHPIRTEGNKSPMQLWIGGLHNTQFGQAMMSRAQDPVTEVILSTQNMFDNPCAHFINEMSTSNMLLAYYTSLSQRTFFFCYACSCFFIYLIQPRTQGFLLVRSKTRHYQNLVVTNFVQGMTVKSLVCFQTTLITCSPISPPSPFYPKQNFHNQILVVT